MTLFNHHRRIILLSAFLGIALGNCTHSGEETNRQKFPETITINTADLDSIAIPPVLLEERRVITTPEYLVSMNIKSDTIFRVFRLPDCQYMGGFGKHGRGPKDFNGATISGLRPELKYHGIIAPDIKSVYHIQFPSTDNLNNQNVIFEDRYSIPGALSPLNGAFILNDSIVCGQGGIRSGKELAYFNTNNDSTGDMIDYPDLFPRASPVGKYVIFQNRIAISPDKSSIAFLYKKFPLMRIYDVEEKSTKETYVDEGPPQIKMTVGENGGINSRGQVIYSYYNNMKVTNQYIYGSFQEPKVTKKQIHVFDWEGKPRLKIISKIDWMKVFTASQDDKYLYFINPYKKDLVYRYNLSEHL